MSPLGPASSIPALGTLRPAWETAPLRDTAPLRGSPADGPAPSGGGAAFGEVLEKMVAGVEDRQAASSAITRSILLGENPHLHQGVIAMQEASVAFSLMVEVRNKVVESYQELMRLPV